MARFYAACMMVKWNMAVSFALQFAMEATARLVRWFTVWRRWIFHEKWQTCRRVILILMTHQFHLSYSNWMGPESMSEISRYFKSSDIISNILRYFTSISNNPNETLDIVLECLRPMHDLELLILTDGTNNVNWTTRRPGRVRTCCPPVHSNLK